jgi:hypothetical protein
MIAAIQAYDVVLAGHIAAVVIAFGATFSYPVLFGYVERHHPRAVPAAYGLAGAIGRRVMAPAAVLAFALGAYLASDRDYWSEAWVTVPLVILIVVMGISGAFLAPRSRRAEELAARDLKAAGHQDVVWSPELLALRGSLRAGGLAIDALVLVAIFFMAAKPFA